MSEQIIDGKGTSHKAKVDSTGRIWVYSTNRTEIAFQSEYNEKAYIAYGKRNFTSGGVNENICYFKYTGTGTCHISKIQVSTNSELAKIEMYIHPTYTSGGASRTPLNLNLESGNLSYVTFYEGSTDIVASVDSINEVMDIRLSKNGSTTYTFDFSGGFILGRDNDFLLLGEVASAGDKVRTAIYYYEEED